MTLHRNTNRTLARWSDIAMAASLLMLFAATIATAGAALQPMREAIVIVSYESCDAEPQTSPG